MDPISEQVDVPQYRDCNVTTDTTTPTIIESMLPVILYCQILEGNNYTILAAANIFIT